MDRSSHRTIERQALSPSLIHAEKLAYRVVEAAHSLAISRSRLYELIGAGEIKILKDGSRTLILRTELESYLDRLAAKQTR